MTEMRQVELAAGDSRLVTWLPDDRRLRPGTRLTLKDFHDPACWWRIVWASTLTLPREALHRRWNVGGL